MRKGVEGVKIKDGEEETVGSNKDVIQTLFSVAVKKDKEIQSSFARKCSQD